MSPVSPDLTVNKGAVKVLAMAVGVREAARRMGLPEERVMKWSQRDPQGPWTVQLSQALATKPSAVSAKVSAPVREASDAMANSMHELSKRGKLAYLKAGVKVGEHLAKAPADELLAQGADVKAWASTTALAGSWQDQSAKTAVLVNINLLGLSPDQLRTVQDVGE